MFSFFKSTIEKDLIKLGYATLVESYRQKVKAKKWNHSEFKNALKTLHDKHLNEINNIQNVNVATRQSFVDDELLTPLNLQNIQDEYIDFDFIYSSLLFEYNNHNRVHEKAVSELDRHLSERFPDATLSETDLEKVQSMDIRTLIDEASQPMENSNKNYLKTVFAELKNRL